MRRIPVATRCLAFCLFLFLASSETSISGETDQESQLIAEAVWAYVNTSGYDDRVDAAVQRMRVRHPNSSRVAYWEARLRRLDSEMSTVLSDIVDAMVEMPDDGQQNFPDNKPVSPIATLRAQLQAKLDSSDELNSPERAYLAALRCVELDPANEAGWQLLATCGHRALALMACRRWSDADPMNALPHFAKAMILEDALFDAEVGTSDDPQSRYAAFQGGQNDIAVREKLFDGFVAAVREGVQCGHCTFSVPRVPEDFEGIFFGAAWDEVAAGVSGQAVSHSALTFIFHQREQMWSWADNSCLSAQAFRYLDYRVVERILDLEDEQQVEILQSICRMHRHLFRSNSLQPVIGFLPRVSWARLSRIAANHQDWEACEGFLDAYRELLEGQQQVADRFLEARRATHGMSFGEEVRYYLSSEYVDGDLLASKIAVSFPAQRPLPSVVFRGVQTAKQEFALDAAVFPHLQAGTAAATTLVHEQNPTFIRFDVFRNQQNTLYVSGLPYIQNVSLASHALEKRRADGKFYLVDLNASEISSLADTSSRLMSLDDQLELIDNLNRSKRQSVGVYIVLQPGLDWCALPFWSLPNHGYWNERDACVVASKDRISLSSFREQCTVRNELRTAWIVPVETFTAATGGALNEMLSSAKEFCSGIALECDASSVTDSEVLQVGKEILEQGFFLHLIESGSKPLSARVRRLGSVVVTKDVDALF